MEFGTGYYKGTGTKQKSINHFSCFLQCWHRAQSGAKHIAAARPRGGVSGGVMGLARPLTAALPAVAACAPVGRAAPLRRAMATCGGVPVPQSCPPAVAALCNVTTNVLKCPARCNACPPAPLSPVPPACTRCRRGDRPAPRLRVNTTTTTTPGTTSLASSPSAAPNPGPMLTPCGKHRHCPGDQFCSLAIEAPGCVHCWFCGNSAGGRNLLPALNKCPDKCDGAGQPPPSLAPTAEPTMTPSKSTSAPPPPPTALWTPFPARELTAEPTGAPTTLAQFLAQPEETPPPPATVPPAAEPTTSEPTLPPSPEPGQSAAAHALGVRLGVQSLGKAARTPASVKEAQGASVCGKLYVFGGFLNGWQKFTNAVYEYTPSGNKWAQMKSIPAGHAGLTHAGNAWDEATCTIYLSGGVAMNHNGLWPGGAYAEDHVLMYHAPSNSWSALPDLPAARGGGAAVVLNGELHHFCGATFRGGFQQDKADHWAISLSHPGAGWKTRAKSQLGRNHLGVSKFGGKIFIIGGQFLELEGCTNQKLSEVYDPVTNTMERIADLPVGTGHISPSTLITEWGPVVAAGATNTNKCHPPGNHPKQLLYYNVGEDKWFTVGGSPFEGGSCVTGLIGDVVYSQHGTDLTKGILKWSVPQGS